jgi:hypothetical protein
VEVISELITDVRRSVVANRNYGNVMQILGSGFCDRDFNRNQLNLNQEPFL